MLHDHCYVAGDYAEELAACATRSGLAAMEQIIQIPFNQQVAAEKSAEEKERTAQRRREQGLRLQQMAVARRAERLRHQEEQLQQYLDVLESRKTVSRADFQEQLAFFDFKTEAQLADAVKHLQARQGRRGRHGALIRRSLRAGPGQAGQKQAARHRGAARGRGARAPPSSARATLCLTWWWWWWR